MNLKSNLSRYYLSTALDWLALGIYTVTMSWFVVTSTGSTSAVGWFYFSASLASLIVTPIVGAELDQPAFANRVFIITQALKILALLTPLFLINVVGFNLNSVSILLLIAVVFGPCNALSGSSNDVIWLHDQGKEVRAHAAKRSSLVRQLALASGFALSGLMISSLSIAMSGLVGAVCCLISGALAFFAASVQNKITEDKGSRQNFIQRCSSGLAIVVSRPAVMLACVCIALGFSISQLSNSLLAPIILLQGKGPDEFGLVSSAWACGAIGVALTMNIVTTRARSAVAGLLDLMLMGSVTIAFAFSSSILFQLILFACIGGIFSFLRIHATQSLALATSSSEIGRVNSSLSAMVSFMALGMYLLPSILSTLSPATIFAAWGGIVISVAAVSLGYLQRMAGESATESNS